MTLHDPSELPDGLPAPADDGAADHLAGMRVPEIELRSTAGDSLLLARPGRRRLAVIYVYPRTGRPGEAPLSPDWDQIPGARGCTPESCSFRDHHAELARAGADVFGMSTQTTDYQAEAVERLRLPFALLSDRELKATRALGLPTFEVAGEVLCKRLTLVICDGAVEHVFYPVFPPDGHAEEVLDWLRARPRADAGAAGPAAR